MAKLDPKLVKKIKQSSLIAAAKILSIKNAEKVSKETLIPVFIKTVEALPEADQESLDTQVIETYNSVIEILGLNKEPEVKPEPESLDTDADADTDADTDVKKAPKAEKKPGVPKEKKGEDLERHRGKVEKGNISRIEAICQVIKKSKKGTWKELGEKADALYKENGGSDSFRHTLWMTNMVIKTLISFGILKKDGKVFSLVK